MTNIENLKQKLGKLKEEHLKVEEEMASMMEKPLHDQLALQRLKKRKLRLKDEILKIKTKLFPDIIA